jgi:hypothetical protein
LAQVRVAARDKGIALGDEDGDDRSLYDCEEWWRESALLSSKRVLSGRSECDRRHRFDRRYCGDCQEFGALVVTCPWTDHYAEARNVALAPISTDWVLVLDGDEELTVKAKRMISTLLECSERISGYTLTFRNYFKDRITGMLGSLSRENKDSSQRAKVALSHAEHCNCRLFRRHPQIYFAGRIHEGVESQILAAGFEYRDSNIDVLHFGTEVAAKQEYYCAITKLAVKEAPNNPHLWL